MDMEQTKITTNRIEEVLLEKKQREYVSGVKKAVDNLCNAVNCGQCLSAEPDKKAFKDWVSGLICYGWNTISAGDRISKDNLPDCVNEALLKQAVDEFIQSVESTKEVIESLDM
jgi:hypothetical protein